MMFWEEQCVIITQAHHKAERPGIKHLSAQVDPLLPDRQNPCGEGRWTHLYSHP